jgi:hypothetical protein
VIVLHSKKIAIATPNSKLAIVGLHMVSLAVGMRFILPFRDIYSRTDVFSFHSDGAASIESQGCTDPPLLSVAGDVTTPLAFVHVVNPEVEQVQAVTANCSTAYESDSSEEELQSSEDDSSAEQRKEGGSAYEFDISEEELQFSQEDSSAEQQKEEESSDEEFEF